MKVKVVAVGHDNEFGIKRMASVGRKFVPFPIRCSIVGARQTFRELQVIKGESKNDYKMVH